MRAILASIVTVIGVALGQQTCQWYDWGSDDWPVDQNFSQSEYALTHPHSYLDSGSFAQGGPFYGQKWQTVFFTRPNYYRPLGFRYGVLGPWNIPTICLNISGGGNFQVEVMAYSFTPGASLAAADLTTDQFNLQSNGAANVLGNGKLYQCFTGPTDASAYMQIAIYCPRNNCKEGNTNLLWRLRRSAVSFNGK